MYIGCLIYIDNREINTSCTNNLTIMLGDYPIINNETFLNLTEFNDSMTSYGNRVSILNILSKFF